MKKAIEKLEKVSSDERMLEKYRDREKAKIDHLSSIRSAERRGAYETKIETAKNLLKSGVNIELIVSATNLPIKTVEELKNEMKYKPSTHPHNSGLPSKGKN